MGVAMWGIGVARSGTSGHAVGQALKEQAWFHALHFLGLFLTARAVFIVWVILEVLQSESFSFLHEWTLVLRVQSLPGLTEHLTEYSIMQVRILQGQTFALIFRPHHESVHRPPDP